MEKNLKFSICIALHVHEDVENMKLNLNEFTAFPFENVLGTIKRFVNSGNRPLEQLCSRVEQDLFFDETEMKLSKEFEILKHIKSEEGSLINIQRLKWKNFILTTKEPNNVVLLNDGSIVRINKMQSFGFSSRRVQLSGKKFNNMMSAFVEPMDSKLLNIFSLNEKDISDSECFSLNEINCKIVLLKIFELASDEKLLYALPLLHTT